MTTGARRWWSAAACAAVLLGAACPWARAESRGAAAAVVAYADGSEFAVVDARGVTVQTDPADPVGLELVAGDTVVTERGTFLELALVPSSNVIKIAENTNFTIVERSSPRGGSFAVVYGKVRARVDALTDKERFSIRGASAIAAVRGTDFGVTVEIARDDADTSDESGDADDAPAAEDSPPVTQIYCFEGEVEVASPESPESPESGEATPEGPLVIQANQIVSIGPEGDLADATVRPLSEEVRTFWETNAFKSAPVARSVRPVEAQVAAAKPATDAPVAPVAPSGAPTKEETEAAVAAREAELEKLLAAEVVAPRPRVSGFSIALIAGGAALAITGAVDALVPSVSFTAAGGRGLMWVGAVFVVAGTVSALQARAPQPAAPAP